MSFLLHSEKWYCTWLHLVQYHFYCAIKMILHSTKCNITIISCTRGKRMWYVYVGREGVCLIFDSYWRLNEHITPQANCSYIWKLKYHFSAPLLVLYYTAKEMKWEAQMGTRCLPVITQAAKQFRYAWDDGIWKGRNDIAIGMWNKVVATSLITIK